MLKILSSLSTDATIISSQDGSIEDARRETERRVDLLKQELLTAASMESIRTKVVDSSYAYQVILKSLFKAEPDPDDKLIAAGVQERDEAVSEYLHIHRDLQHARRDLSATQVQALDYQDENRKLVQLLSQETAAMKEAATSQDSGSNRRMLQKVEEELRNITVKHNVVSNVLQGLILESGIDWANDPHYLELMLKLKRSAE
ncbi:centromere protein H (CENP-H)-domain-containing protein [Gamsiella multidivaricata]|uniref:centromere protein H (CENP-H)-domain-containing protein n=1 Tax=Gamsiella multidivaricata TaxID=101098 RepID=UPI00221FE84F|nr:centromere protein H (CENP-H)-domain-containing protein [Gamsiella multidivaricata]KAI7815954.1 centromere protein H (CENP-H)-domain-containing protein [Gamsiella multidivaricata]